MARAVADGGVGWAALTDHNTLAGQELFREFLEKKGVGVITGLEMDARSPVGPLHLLAYGFDLQNPVLIHTLHAVRHPVRASARRLIRRALPSNGRSAVSSVDFPFEDNGLVSQRLPSTSEAIQLIHAAGGRVFLAHPLASLHTIERLEAVLDWLQPEGLDGLEALHKPYSEDTQRLLVEVAKRRHLLVVGGSDFHGRHHTDGTSPGIDMPLESWDRFATAIGLGAETRASVSTSDGPPLSGEHVENL